MTRDLDLYRPNVGLVLFSPVGKVFHGRRVGTPPPHNWQFPQGGVDKGEDLYAAALRELYEETGVRSVSLLDRTLDWIAYDYPPEVRAEKRHKGYLGQKQVWFALRFEGEENEIDLEAHGDPEFDAWRWGDLGETRDVAPFKLEVYETVARAFARFAG